MAEFRFKSLSEAFEAMLNGQHEFQDETRRTAQSVVRQICEDRIYNGRRPATMQHAWLSIQLLDTEPVEDTEQPGQCAYSTIETTCYSKDPAERERLVAAVGQTLRRVETTVALVNETVRITSCMLVSSGEDEPQKTTDASADYWHEHPLVWRVRHPMVTPVGLT